MYTEIQTRIKTLNEVIRSVQRQVQNLPDGSLRISHSHDRTQYYHARPGARGKDRYLSQKEAELCRQLAQKSYFNTVLRSAELELNAWKTLVDLLPEHTFEDDYRDLSVERKQLVQPIYLTDEEYRRRWEAVEYEPGFFKPDTPVYLTDRGERVRSKSEQLIANLLYRLGIPYRYEYPIEIIENGVKKTWRPDFMILDVKHRKEFFLEHLGMMDDVNYARRNLHKIDVYEQNGLYEGHGMYYSIETEGVPPDMKALERKILRILDSPTGGIEP